ncbi:MAG: hypothetical protein Q4E61_00845, partial [Alphaproteobacteria bacterium]|nr:hypothetical protein [Alphaproteobacteria bacterium]
MNKKVLVGLLISFIACEAMAVASTSIPPFSPIVNRQKIDAEAVDSPMTQLIKQRKAKKSSVPLVKSVLQRTRTLEDSKKKLTEEVSGLTQKNIDQQIQIGYSKFIA